MFGFVFSNENTTFWNPVAITHVDGRHGPLTRLEGFDDVYGAGQGSEVVAALAGQQRRVHQTPHVLGLDLRVHEFAPHHRPHYQGQKLVGAQRYRSACVRVLHLLEFF